MPPRGIRNNNPGNIVRSGDGWAGMADGQDDDRFVVFVAPEWGIRAIARVLTNYARRHQLNTVKEVIARWAPASDGNDTAAYYEAVADRLSVEPDEVIEITHPEIMRGLVVAIIRHENGMGPLPGGGWYEDALIDQGIAMAATWIGHPSAATDTGAAGRCVTRGQPSVCITMLFNNFFVPFGREA